MLTASTLQKTVYTVDEANGQRLPIMSNVHVIPSDMELSLVGAAEIAAMDSGKTIYYTFRFPIGSRLEGFVRYIPHGANAVYIAGAKTLASVNASLARIQNDAIARSATGGWLSNNIGLIVGIVAATIVGVGVAGAMSSTIATTATAASTSTVTVGDIVAGAQSAQNVVGAVLAVKQLAIKPSLPQSAPQTADAVIVPAESATVAVAQSSPTHSYNFFESFFFAFKLAFNLP